MSVRPRLALERELPQAVILSNSTAFDNSTVHEHGGAGRNCHVSIPSRRRRCVAQPGPCAVGPTVDPNAIPQGFRRGILQTSIDIHQATCRLPDSCMECTCCRRGRGACLRPCSQVCPCATVSSILPEFVRLTWCETCKCTCAERRQGSTKDQHRATV